MRVLKQSTAATVMLGPFLDKADGVTEEAGLAGAGTEISKAGAAFGAGPVLGTLDSDGWYPISLTTTHTNTLGDLTVKVHDAATHLPVWAHFSVLPANAYDSMVSGSGVGMRSDVQGWLGTAPPAVHTAGYPIVTIKDGTGTGEINTNAGAVAVVDVVTAVTGLTASNLDATVSSRMATYTQPTGFLAATFPAGTVANTTNITAGTVTTCTNLTNAATAGDLTATMKTSVTTAATAATPTAAAVTGAVGSVTAGVTVTTNNDKTGYGLSAAAVQAVWDALTSALTTVGSIGKKLADWTIGTAQTGDAFARLGAPAGASISADVAAVKVDTAATLDDTGTSGVVVAAGSKTGYALSAAGITAIWAEVMAGTTTAVQAMRGFLAVLLGKASGLATTTAVFRDVADTKDVITATVDADGNRTAVTRDLT